MPKNKVIISLVAILVIGLASIFLVSYANKEDTDNKDETTVNSYEDCVEATGGIILETYPEKCMLDGQSFTRELTDEESKNLQNNTITGKTGEEIELENTSIKVNASKVTDQEAKTETREVLQVEFELKNTSTSDKISYKLTDFWIEGSDYNRNSSVLGLDTEKYPTTIPTYGIIDPGKSVYLYSTFEINQGDYNNTKFTYQPNDWDGKAIVIDLAE